MTDNENREAVALVEKLRAFAAGCRGSMWQSRDETIRLCDGAADLIESLSRPMEAVAWQWRYGDAEWMTRDNRPDWFDDEKANPRFYSRALAVIPTEGLGSSLRDTHRVAETAVLVTLAECPPGLFWFGDTLGFKTEYGHSTGKDAGGGKVEWTAEAFCVETGEYFWGGAPDLLAREELMVAPVSPGILRQQNEPNPPIPTQGGEGQ